MIRAAISGLGRWGQNLVNSVAGSGAISFTMANTRTRETSEAFRQSNGLRWTADLDEILQDAAIDAVVFATPHSLHPDQVRRAVAAGKHVFVEKPFALTLADADQMLAAAEKAGVVLAVGFNRRFHPSMSHLRAAIRSGALGTLVTVSAEQTALHGLELTEAAWRARPEEAPAGAMTAIGVHLVDGMIDLMGPVASVFAKVSRRAATFADDTTDVLLTFTSGASGHIICSTTAAPNYRFAVYGTKGWAEVRDKAHPEAPQGWDLTVTLKNQQKKTREYLPAKAVLANLEAFADAAAGGAPYPVPQEQMIANISALEAVFKSARSGNIETVDNGDGK